MPEITISMDDADFDKLCEDALRWQGDDWKSKASRFKPHRKELGTEPRWDWKAAYWMGQSWASVILARSYIQSKGEEYEIVSDEAAHPNGQWVGYVILTNYECPAHPLFS